MGTLRVAVNTLRYVRSGAVAGATSALAFAGIHDVFISDIWFSAIAMTIAGATCGVCVGWTYALLFRTPSVRSWLEYNLAYFGMFVLLGAASVVVHEPVTTIAALIEANEPPNELFGKAMPMTVIFLVVMATALSLLYGRDYRHCGAILLTCAVLIALLGLNVSAIGLVHVPSGSVHLIAELFGLIFVLNAVYAAVFLLIERSTLSAGRASRDAA